MWLCVRAPHCLVLLQIEVIVLGQQVDHLYLDFSLGVCKSTELFVVTFAVLIGVAFAELGFISARVIHLLNFVM